MKFRCIDIWNEFTEQYLVSIFQIHANETRPNARYLVRVIN